MYKKTNAFSQRTIFFCFLLLFKNGFYHKYKNKGKIKRTHFSCDFVTVKKFVFDCIGNTFI